jgi:hypothetical protein
VAAGHAAILRFPIRPSDTQSGMIGGPHAAILRPLCVVVGPKCVLTAARLAVKSYYWQVVDRVKFFPHFDMLVFAPDTRSLVTGDRVGNPLGDIAGE